MDLLKYEFMTCPSDSYNGYLKALVKRVRFLYKNVSPNDFTKALPELREMQNKILKVDAQFGDAPRNYIQEILEELSKQTETVTKIEEELVRYANAILRLLYNEEVKIEDLSYEIVNNEAVDWITFYGYKEKRNDGTEIVIKEALRYVCYNNNFIFIDSSLN